ncbi:MAG: hypothetical protein ACFCUU_02560 [Cyclobacteriaceae bacterium]
MELEIDISRIMRHINRLFIILCSSVLILGISSCEDVPEELELNEFQKNAKLLSEKSPWGGNGKVEAIALPTGVDPEELAALSLTFNSTGRPEFAPSTFVAAGAETYLSSEAGAFWNWTTSTSVLQITGASVTQLTNVDISEDQLIFSFEISPTQASGRTSGFDGQYRLALSPN